MLTFKQAFDAARKAGNRYFSWNGNDYNTMTKEEQNSGIGDYFSKFRGNVGDNSNFQKAASNMGSQIRILLKVNMQDKIIILEYILNHSLIVLLLIS